MLCSVCHKNEAVLVFTEIINGEKKEQHLCKECAGKYTGFGKDNFSNPGSFLTGLLASVLGQFASAPEEDNIKKTNLVCPRCQMTYNEFLKYGKFGCGECLNTFGFILDEYLKKIQVSCNHTGKKLSRDDETVHLKNIHREVTAEPTQRQKAAAKKSAPADEINILQEQLNTAVKAEEYEEAAKLRDRIRMLKEAKTDETMV